MRVLIIGGGLGGLMAAHALRRRGLPVAVYEAASELPDADETGVWLPPNAMQVLGRLGLAEAVEEAGVRLEEAAVETPDGTELLAVDFAQAPERFGAPGVALPRRALAALLAEHLPAHVVHGGRTCTGFSERGEQVTARFEDGTEVSGEVLVGADGAASGVRRRLFPSAALREAGQVRYEAVTAWPRGHQVAHVRAAYERAALEVWGTGARFGFMPIGGGRVHWYATQRAADAPLPSRAPGAVKALLAERYGAFPALARALIQATPAGALLRTEPRDLAPMKRWHRGRVVLLGDAAHAATPDLGQNVAQAIEDAYVLAQALAEHGPPEAAFSKYEDARRAKAHRVVRRSRRLGQWAHAEGAWARRLRDGALRLAPAALRRRQIEQLYALAF